MNNTDAPGSGRYRQVLSLSQLRDGEIPLSPRSRRGYDRQAVDGLVQRAAEEIEVLRQQSARDRAENARLSQLLSWHRHGTGADPHGGPSAEPARPTGVDLAAVAMREEAQRYGDQVLAQAQQQAAQLVHTAQQQARAVRQAAHEEADRAAQQYRSETGRHYSTDREQTIRVMAVLRFIHKTFAAARMQIEASNDAFSAELPKLLADLEAIAGYSPAGESHPIPQQRH